MKAILTRMFIAALLMIFSMGVRADVKILYGEKGTEKFEGTGGTIEVKQEDSKDDKTKVTVTLIVTPSDGYTLAEKNSLEVYAVISPDGASTRALEISGDALDLTCNDFKDISQKRTYTVDIDSNLALWVKSANFQPKKRDGAKSGENYYAIYLSDKGYLKNVANGHETNFSNFATNSKWTFTAEGKLKCGTVYLKDNGATITTTETEDEATAWTKETSGVKSYFKTSDGKYMKSGWLLSEGVSEEDDRYVGYEVKGDDRVIWIPAGSYVLINKNIDYARTDKNPPNLLYDPKQSNKQIKLKQTSKVAAEDTRWEVTHDGDGYYFLKNVGTGNNIRHSSTTTRSNPTAELVSDPSSNNSYRFILKVYGNNGENNFQHTISKYDPWCFDICPYNVQSQSFNVPSDNVNNTIALRDFYYEGKLSFGSQWHFIPYETEDVDELKVLGKTILTSIGDYIFTATGNHYTKVVGSENPNTNLPITVDGVINSNITYVWSLLDPPSFVQLSTETTTGNTSSVTLSVNSLPSSSTTIRLKCKATAANGYSWEKVTIVNVLIVEEIESLDEIDNPDGIYKLTKDVTSSSGISSEFRGTLDGDFHTIKGLRTSLFTSLKNAVVKNVLLDDVSINNQGEGSDAGAICNEADGSTKIYNCGVLSGAISGSGNVGGLVGHINSGSSVRVVNCYNFAKVSGGSTMAGIVGNNEGTVGNVRIALCMMYGDMSGGTSPVYAGNHTNNVSNFTEYNYWRSKANLTYTTYNDQLAIDKDEYLTRFPFYRHILNTHRELAAFFLFGESGETVNDITTDEIAEIGHWVLKKDVAPYPIVEEWKTNTKRTTEDIANNLPNTTEKGAGKLLNNIGDDGYYTGDGTKITAMGSSGYLTVNVTIVSNSNTHTYSVNLPITDMNEDNYDYTWGKVVLPFANEFSGWTRDYDYVCTGWEITDVGDETSASVSNYNFADRDNKKKDIYHATDNPYIYAQGGNYIVPYGVSTISINAHFAKAFYLSDPTYEVGYNANYTTATPLGGYVYNSTEPYYHGKKVYTSLSDLVTDPNYTMATNPNEQAIVLVGNYHFNLNIISAINANDGAYTTPLDLGKAVTIMSTDEDNNQEPDYGWYTCNTKGRINVPPIRFDFLPNIEMGMSSRVGSNVYPGVGIWHTRGWFELTETCVSNMSQCEINSSKFTTDDDDTGNNRWIANSGCFVQIVRARTNPCVKLSYIQIGGNAYVKELYPGCHSDNARTNTAVPIVVTGGQVDECYMTGYTAGGKLNGDIYFWCAGGRIKKFLGAYLEEPQATTGTTAGMTAKVDHALIGRFFGGGTSVGARIKGNIETTINNSQVDFYCGGPEFGDMNTGKMVITRATGTIFGEYYGAGFGGTSITYNKEIDEKQYEFPGDENPFPLAFSNYKRLEKKANYGIGSCYKFEYIYHSSGSLGVARFHTGYAQFSLATTGNVTNTLTNCIIKKLPGTNSLVTKATSGEFYGAGCQGKVDGTVTSTLTNCTIERNAFGGGYKAESNDVEVYTTAPPTYSVYTKETGIFSDFGEFPTPETYTWAQGDATHDGVAGTEGNAGKLFTGKDIKLTDLGNVTGAISITIDGGYVGGTAQGATPEVVATDPKDAIPAGGSVYGGGNESKSLSDTSVTLTGNAVVYGDVFGGGNKAEVSGSATVNIKD